MYGSSARFAVALTVGIAAAVAHSQNYPIDRSHLPIPDPNYPRSTILDARDATPPPRFEVRAPEGAPNVLIVLSTTWASAYPAP
jgi:hypothetical protein